MKIPDEIREKRISQTKELYHTISLYVDEYSSKIYEIITMEKNEKEIEKLLKIINEDLSISKKEKNELQQFIKNHSLLESERKIVKMLVIECLEKDIETILTHTKKNYKSYNSKEDLNLEELLYKDDNKRLDERIDDWYKAEIDSKQLAYQMWVIINTESLHLIPRVMQKRLPDNAYIEIIYGGGECNSDCLEWADGEAWPENEVELPPYHPNCGCETTYYEEYDFPEYLENENLTIV